MKTVEQVLAHYGIKGMHWGVRRGRNVSAKHPPSEDFTRTRATKQQAKESGTKSLSNKEMQDVINRLNLEQQYARLNPKSTPVKNGHQFVKDGLAIFGTASAVYAATQSPLAKQIKVEMQNKKASARNKAAGVKAIEAK